MRYTFEVTTHETENIIKLEVNTTGGYNSNASRTIKQEAGGDDYNCTLDELLSEIIDNMRLTVKEREDALYNANVFKDYLTNYTIKKSVPQMIIENEDPAVVNIL